MRRVFIFAWIAASLGAADSGPAFLPLEPGNQWIYQSRESSEILNLQVHRSKKVDGFEYYLMSGFAPGDVWIRSAPGGEIFVRDMKTGTELKIAHLGFGAPAYDTDLGGCMQQARPATEPDAVLRIGYESGPCRDVGITQERYGAGIGMVQRTITTLRGPVTFTLDYAKVGGRMIATKAGELVVHFDFGHGAAGWLAGFSDYSLVNGDMHFAAESRVLPEELGAEERQGFFLRSMNRSDDMFMFLKKGLYLTDGLKPNQRYMLTFDIAFASNAQNGCVGVGGAPGEGVYLKAGAAADEPVAVAAADKHLDLNMDKGHQSQSGSEAGVVGDIANGEPCEAGDARFVRVRKSYEHPHAISTDDRAQLWLMVGTDSAFEGLTGIYYESVTLRLREVE